MKYLLDINVVIAAAWRNHSKHTLAAKWIEGKQTVLCPLSEIGFLRLSSTPKIMNATMEEARALLHSFTMDLKVEWIPDDMRAMISKPASSAQVTDHYLADLAWQHGLKLATLDGKIAHPNVEVIS